MPDKHDLAPPHITDMPLEQEQAPKQIIDMTREEKEAARAADPIGFFKRAYEEERPRAEQQVKRVLERRLRQLGREGLSQRN